MGDCTYCKEPIGFFRQSHRRCKKLYLKGRASVIELVKDMVAGKQDFASLENEILDVAKNSFIEPVDLRDVLVAGLIEAAAYETLERLNLVKNHFELTLEELRRGAPPPTWSRMGATDSVLTLTAPDSSKPGR